MNRRVVVIAGLLIAVAALVFVLVERQPSPPTSAQWQKLAVGIERFSHDCISRGQPLPQSMTLQDLAAGGYVSAEDARAFDGMEVTIHPGAGSSRDPQSVLIRVRLPGGDELTLMGDGKVQQLAK